MKLKLKRRIIFAGKTMRTRRLVWVTLAGLFARSEMASAQSVIAPPPSVSVTPSFVRDQPPGEMQVFQPESPFADFMDNVQLLQWGPVTVRPHISYEFISGTGIQSAPGQENNTIIQTISPGVLFEISPHWTLDYTPTVTIYSSTNFQNSVNQAVALTGATDYENWDFGFSQLFTYSTSPDVQTGTQVTQQNYSTGISASRPINSEMSIDLGVNQDLSFVSDYQDTLQWSTMDWLNYQFWPRLVAGVGAGFGYVNATPDNVFEQLQARVNWRATDKISFGINVGGEFTEFLSGGADTLVNPVFGASIQYQPFDHTQLSLNASRAVSSSYFQNEVTENTSVSADVNQRLLKNFYLDVSAGYNTVDYVAAASVLSTNRTDDTYSFNVQVSTTLFKRVSTAVFYRYSDNISTLKGYTYKSNQVGFNVGYQF
jgi:hypothetical protein